MISLISTDLWEKLGLPSMPLDGMSFPVIGVSGKSTRCRSWVPGVTLYLTENRRPTNTNVFVLDEVANLGAQADTTVTTVEDHSRQLGELSVMMQTMQEH